MTGKRRSGVTSRAAAFLVLWAVLLTPVLAGSSANALGLGPWTSSDGRVIHFEDLEKLLGSILEANSWNGGASWAAGDSTSDPDAWTQLKLKLGDDINWIDLLTTKYPELKKALLYHLHMKVIPEPATAGMLGLGLLGLGLLYRRRPVQRTVV